MSGKANFVADALFQTPEINILAPVDFSSVTVAQKDDAVLLSLQSGSNTRSRSSLFSAHISLSNARSLKRNLGNTFQPISVKNCFILCTILCILTTNQLVFSKYFWPPINKDVDSWARNCIACQKCEVTRHATKAVGVFLRLTRCFHFIHLDVVRSLRDSHGYKYYLAVIDRFMRWPGQYL